MKRYILTIMLALVSMSALAQLQHTKGQMGAGLRAGIGYNGYDIGLMYNYHFNNDVALLVELDREKAEFDYSDFTNTILLGAGANVKLWNPTLWLYMHGSATANVGYDEWDCKVVDWTHENIVYGASAGLDFEVYPWHYLSFVLKARQWILFGEGNSYAKPDFSMGVKYNW